MTVYYSTTRFYQNDQEFQCSWDLNATKGAPSDEETIQHLAAMLSENFAETWNLDEDDEYADQPSQTTLNLHGLSPQDFARVLVLNEKDAESLYGVTWVISTLWKEVDPDNWEHPCNL